MLVSVRGGQIIGEDLYSGCQCGKFGGNKTKRLSKNLGRDVKAGSDLVLGVPVEHLWATLQYHTAL